MDKPNPWNPWVYGRLPQGRDNVQQGKPGADPFPKHASDPISADPICPFPKYTSTPGHQWSIYIYVYVYVHT